MRLTKAKAFVILIYMCVFYNCKAEKPKISLGFNGGVGHGLLRGNPLFDMKKGIKLCSSFGLDVGLNLNESISINSGIWYSNKGARMKNITLFDANATPTVQSDIIENFNFINIPLTFELKMGKKKHFFIDVGGYYGLLFNQNEYVDIFKKESPKNDKSAYFKNNEFGVLLSAGTIINFSEKVALSIKLRNDIGLNDLAKKSNYTGIGNWSNVQMSVQYQNGTVKTMTTYLTVGLVFKI